MATIMGNFKDGRYYYVTARMTINEFKEFEKEQKQKKVSKKPSKKVHKKKK